VASGPPVPCGDPRVRTPPAAHRGRQPPDLQRRRPRRDPPHRRWRAPPGQRPVRPRAAGGLRRERHGDRPAHRLRGREGDRPLRGADRGAAQSLAAGVDLGRGRTRAGRLRGRTALEPGRRDASAARARGDGGDDPDGPQPQRRFSARSSADATRVRSPPLRVPGVGSGVARRRAQRRGRERGRTRGASGSRTPLPWARPSGDLAGAGGSPARARQGQRQRGGRRRRARSLGPDAGR
jgi:hypothetical protein